MPLLWHLPKLWVTVNRENRRVPLKESMKGCRGKRTGLESDAPRVKGEAFILHRLNSGWCFRIKGEVEVKFLNTCYELNKCAFLYFFKEFFILM